MHRSHTYYRYRAIGLADEAGASVNSLPVGCFLRRYVLRSLPIVERSTALRRPHYARTTNCSPFELGRMIPLGDYGHGQGFGGATARLAGRVSRAFGLAVVLVGVWTLYQLYTDLGVLASSYDLSIGMVTVTFTESTAMGEPVGVAVQLVVFAFLCFFVGGMVLVEATRAKWVA